MTVSDLIEQLQQFHGHESVIVTVDLADVVDMLRPEGATSMDVPLADVEPGSSAQTGTVAKLYLE